MNSNDREAFLALIAPIGIDMNSVVSVLSERFGQITYVPNVLKLTDFLPDNKAGQKKFKNEFDRYNSLISACDDYCESQGRGDILILRAIAALMKGGEEIRIKSVNDRRII